MLCISYFNRRKLCSCCYYYYYYYYGVIEMQIHKQTKFFPISYSIQYLYYQIIHLQDIFQGCILTTEFNWVAHGCSGFFIGGKLKSNMRYKDAFIDMGGGEGGRCFGQALPFRAWVSLCVVPGLCLSLTNVRLAF